MRPPRRVPVAAALCVALLALSAPALAAGPSSPQAARPAGGVAARSTAGAPADDFKRDETPLTGLGSDPAAKDANKGSGGGSSIGGTMARLGLGLIVVVGLIYGVAWLVRRQKRSGKLRLGGDLNVVATTQLGPNRAVHLLRVGDELVLVGSAEHGITPIRVYSGEEAAALDDVLADEGVAGARARSMSSFVDELRRRTAR